jgi:hypothetical protein
MSESELHIAMRFGTRNNPVSASLGKYGMGLKLASLGFARTPWTPPVLKRHRLPGGTLVLTKSVQNGLRHEYSLSMEPASA